MTDSSTKKTDMQNGIAVANCTDLSALWSKAGFFRRVSAGMAVSAEAAKELKQVEIERVRAQGAISRALIATASVEVKAAIVAAEVPKIGALLVTLNGRIDAARQGFTNGAQAGFASHFRNRTNNVELGKQLAADGIITTDEAIMMQNAANAHAAEDIEATQEATQESKKTLDTFRALALHPLRSAKIAD